jgi:hypothetical protein
MTVLKITIPRGDEQLMESLFLSEGRMLPAFPMSFEVNDGLTYRVWHIGEEDPEVLQFIPEGLDWAWWCAAEDEEKEPFEDF